MKILSTKLSKQSEAAKSRYLRPFTYCLVILGFYFTLTYYLRYESKILAISCLCACVAGFLTPLVLRFSKSYIVAANYITLVFTLTLEVLALYTGGLKATSIWWIGITPVLAAFLLNAFYSLFWFGLMILNVLFFVYLRAHDLLPASVVPSAGTDQFLATSTIFGIIIVTALCVLADVLREKTSSEKEELQNKSFRLTQLASLGNLASGVAHEINNPLAVIKGSQLKIKRMIDGDVPVDKKALKDYMLKIDRNVRRIQEITSSMRTISAKDDSKKITPINIHELLMSIASMSKDRIGTREIVIKTNSMQKDLYFSGIYNEMFRAFYNIVENSLDELIDLNRGNGKIEITLEKQVNDIVIYFKDNGRGISNDIKDSIFDPFFTTKGVGKGTGLGLTYSFNVISYNGGTLELLGGDHHGTIFRATLPILEA